MTGPEIDTSEARAYWHAAPEVLAIIDALDAARAEIARLGSEMDERYPCDGLCIEYPEEDCSRHGRTPAELWKILVRDTTELRERAEEAEVQLADTTEARNVFAARVVETEAQVTAVRALCDERDNPNWGKHSGLLMTKWVRAAIDGAVPPPAAGCRIEEVDGDPVLVHGADDWDDIDRAAFADVIRAVKAKHESTHRLPAASADIHKPFTDDGITYCGWDKHEGCGEVWPCATERAKALFLAAAMDGALPSAQAKGSPPNPSPTPTGARDTPATAVPTHAFEMPPAHWCVARGEEPCGHLLDPDDQFSHCRGLAGDPIHGGTS